MPNGEEAGLGIVPSKQRWERKMKMKNRKLVFGGHGRSSTSLDRSAHANAHALAHANSHAHAHAIFIIKTMFLVSKYN